MCKFFIIQPYLRWCARSFASPAAQSSSKPVQGVHMLKKSKKGSGSGRSTPVASTPTASTPVRPEEMSFEMAVQTRRVNQAHRAAFFRRGQFLKKVCTLFTSVLLYPLERPCMFSLICQIGSLLGPCALQLSGDQIGNDLSKVTQAESRLAKSVFVFKAVLPGLIKYLLKEPLRMYAFQRIYKGLCYWSMRRLRRKQKAQMEALQAALQRSNETQNERSEGDMDDEFLNHAPRTFSGAGIDDISYMSSASQQGSAPTSAKDNSRIPSAGRSKVIRVCRRIVAVVRYCQPGQQALFSMVADCLSTLIVYPLDLLESALVLDAAHYVHCYPHHEPLISAAGYNSASLLVHIVATSPLMTSLASGTVITMSSFKTRLSWVFATFVLGGLGNSWGRIFVEHVLLQFLL